MPWSFLHPHSSSSTTTNVRSEQDNIDVHLVVSFLLHRLHHHHHHPNPKEREKEKQQRKLQHLTNNNHNHHQNPKKQKKQNQQPSLQQAIAINKKLIESQSPSEILSLFSELGGIKSTNIFNSVNYSTCLHRLARFVATTSSFGKKNNSQRRRRIRKDVLGDARFAILLCALAEVMVVVSKKEEENVVMVFNSRESSNLVWALAKLGIVPPGSVFEVKSSEEEEEEVKEELRVLSKKVRMEVLEVAKEKRRRRREGEDGGVVKSLWIPTLSQLSGRILDYLGMNALNMIDNLNPQELANLLWAYATTGRADVLVFDKLANRLVECMKQNGDVNDNDNNTKRRKKKKNEGPPAFPKPQELSNSIWAYATAGIVGEGQLTLMKYLSDILTEEETSSSQSSFISQFKPQELSNTAWGIATILSKGTTTTTTSNTNHPTTLLTPTIQQSAIVILRQISKSLLHRVSEFKPQEISNSIWAFATLGYGCHEMISTSGLDSNTNNDNIYLMDGKDGGVNDDRMLVKEMLDTVARDVLVSGRLKRFRPQELNNLIWGCARLGYYCWDDDESKRLMKGLCGGIGEEIVTRKHRFSPQDIATCLWSFATMEYFDETIYRIASTRLSHPIDAASSFKPQEISNVIWSLATAGLIPKYLYAFDTTLYKRVRRMNKKYGEDSMMMMMLPNDDDPISNCFATASMELMRRPDEFKEQEMKDILWGFSKVGVRHPNLFRTIAQHLVGEPSTTQQQEEEEKNQGRGLTKFSPQGLGNLAWSYAKQAQLSWVALIHMDSNDCNLSSNGRLAVYETSCLDYGECLIHRLFRRIAETALGEDDGGVHSRFMKRFKPQDISNTLWAFATLGLVHRSYFDEIAKQIIKRKNNPNTSRSMSNFRPQEIANTFWSYATIYHPSPQLMQILGTDLLSMCCDDNDGLCHVERISQLFKRQELANIMWSCVVLGLYPKDLIKALYTGLLGNSEDDTRERMEDLKRLYGDDGLQKQAIMTLFYAQLAIEKEAPDLGVSLPDKFPEGWGEGDDHQPKSDDEAMEDFDDTTSMLEISTSRLQYEISQALTRIGFQHQQEHVIRTTNLLSDHQINLSSESIEILSLDAANLDDKIGIEVDGPAHFISDLTSNHDVDDDYDYDYYPSIPPNDVRGNGKATQIADNTKVGWQFKTLGRTRRCLPNGSTTLKDRLLYSLGWSIVRLPYWEWQDVNGDLEKEEDYLKDVLFGQR